MFIVETLLRSRDSNLNIHTFSGYEHRRQPSQPGPGAHRPRATQGGLKESISLHHQGDAQLRGK